MSLTSFESIDTQAPASPGVPHSREAEEAVVGAVIINPDIFPDCRVQIQTSEEFYIHRNRWLWEAYEQLSKDNTPIDLITVSEYLEKKNQLAEIGGSSYLTSLINQVPTSLNAPAYANIVNENAIRRNLITAANNIASLAYKGDDKIIDILSKATHEVTKVNKGVRTNNITTLKKSISKIYDTLEERGKTGLLPGIPTGFIELDKLLGGGLQDSDLILIAARPGQGKTATLLQIAKNSACYRLPDETTYDEFGNPQKQKIYVNKRIVIFSLEMPEEQLTLRLISQLSGIDYQVLRSGNIPDNQVSLYIHAVEELSNLDIVIDCTSAATPYYIRSRVEMFNAEKEVDLVIVDSLNLMKGDIRYSKKTDEVDENAYALKALAKDFDVPVLAAHAMNRYIERRSENARPVLSDLDEGGEPAADVVMFIWNKKDETTGEIEESQYIIEKHRNGPTGNVPIVFIKQMSRFESAHVRTEKFGNKK